MAAFSFAGSGEAFDMHNQERQMQPLGAVRGIG